MKNKILKLSATVLFGATLTSCGGSGSGGGTVVVDETGAFLDSAVAGLYYTASPSGKSGRTDNFGQFNYSTNDTIEFKVGGTATGVIIGSASGSAVIIPEDIASGNSTKSAKIAQLLQSMDDDSNADNGIDLTDFVINSTLSATIKNILAVNTATFSANNIASMTGKVVGSVTFVSIASATAHIEKTKKNKDNIKITSGELGLYTSVGSPTSLSSKYIKASVSSNMISTTTNLVSISAALNDFVVDKTSSSNEVYTQLSSTFVNRADASDTFTIIVRMGANYLGTMLNKLYVKCDANSQANCADGSGIHLTNFINNSTNALIDTSSGDASPAKFTKDQGKNLSIGINGGSGSSYTFTINGISHDDSDIGLSLDDSKTYDFSTISLRTSMLYPTNNAFVKSSFDNFSMVNGTKVIKDDFNDGVDNSIWDAITTTTN